MAMEREIRDRLMSEKIDPLMMVPKYLGAVARGDMAFVRAVENAPAAFAFIDDKTRKQGQEERLKFSPLADQLATERAEHAVFAQVVNTTRTHLKTLAGTHGVR